MHFSFNPHNHPGRKGASSPFIHQKAEPPLAKRTAEASGELLDEYQGLAFIQQTCSGLALAGPRAYSRHTMVPSFSRS